MYGNLITLVFLALFISINGQYNDDRDLPRAQYASNRKFKPSFHTQFPHGRCPDEFYQLGDECLYFPNDGKIYSWRQTERVCIKRIARMLSQLPPSNNAQPNLNPTKGVRQVVLNTPQKTELFRALFKELNEQNFAVRLPSDYNTLQRCHDGKDDKWPHFCTNSQYSNSTCFETTYHTANDICLRGVECHQQYLRAACEFTLPGSAELTNSQFRQCPIGARFRDRLPKWAWITIAVVGVLLIGIFAGVFGFISKSKKNAASKKRTLPEPRDTEKKVIRVTAKRDDPATEPMLNRPPPPPPPTNTADTGYLQPRSTPIDNTANA